LITEVFLKYLDSYQCKNCRHKLNAPLVDCRLYMPHFRPVSVKFTLCSFPKGMGRKESYLTRCLNRLIIKLASNMP